ncbi:uncharacterized protein LOC130496889 isoform X2 [Raphanus sativus]|uniref:Uncharacterized protein LOC130496889 isoform X2 n=1 Tax=Raphanus sativus TaxID=3726 RepID=A0A9W3C1W3_RAPSA|nr:uncharacterized protein LOC130496889 isoform X2 [Raphanus sativus]
MPTKNSDLSCRPSEISQIMKFHKHNSRVPLKLRRPVLLEIRVLFMSFHHEIYGCKGFQWLILLMQMKRYKLGKREKNMSNFKIDVDILLLVFSIIVKICNIASCTPQIQCQVRRSTTYLGTTCSLFKTLSDPHPKAPLRWIPPAPTTTLLPPLSESTLLLSMTMPTTHPSCRRPPPDPPPLFLGLMQHCSSLKMMVTALPPPSRSRSLPDPSTNKHLQSETLSPVKPPKPPDPPLPGASVSLATSPRSPPQATQILYLRFNLSMVSSKLSNDDAALVVTGDTIFVYWRSFPVVYRSPPCQLSFPVIYRSYLCQLRNGSSHNCCSSLPFIHSLIDIQVHLSSLLSDYPYSFEWDAMLDVLVTRALVGNVLMDSVSFGYIFMSRGCFYSAIECLMPITSWFQICQTSSGVEYLRCCSCGARSEFRWEDCSRDDLLSVLFKGSASWCHIAFAIPSVVEIRGRLYNVDAAWDAKSRHCDIGGILSGANIITLPNLCKSRNHVSSALMAEAIAVHLTVTTAVYSNIRSLAVFFDSLSLIKLLKNGGSQLELFGIMFDIYHYLFYFDVVFCIFIFGNFNGESDLVAKSALSLVVTIPLIGV